MAIQQVESHECFLGFDGVMVSRDNELVGFYYENSPNMFKCPDENSNEFNDDELPDDDCEAVKHRPVLWDFTNKNLLPDRNPTNKKRLWKEVYEAVKDHFPNVTAVKNKWRNLTITFNKNLKAANPKKVSGMEGQPPKEVKWKYYKLMSFLSKSNLSYNSFTESSMDSDSQSQTTNNDDCESQDGSIQGAERIGQRKTKKRRTEDALHAILEAVANPPPIQGRKMDAIKAFITFVEEKLREYPKQIAARLMLKMHELFFTEEDSS
ncbi:hypothetical protein QAD02_008891 [Eretmocerus hayati]|uniref:Uncharacterized protein n=1 Tax=Eretmocerus hayati TaxID=131215 RepID=A0ACC2N851_9HYME|nr:hypothetical protein QAD02_008891 [Eretmocerus hayati]